VTSQGDAMAMQRAAGQPAPSMAGRRGWTRDIHMSPSLIFSGILVLAAALRVVELGWHSVWLDEAFVVSVTRESWRGLLTTLRAADSHPPLYYLLIKAWTDVAGTGETALRFPSAFASVATVALTYALARRVAGTPAALLSAFLVAMSPFAIMAGQEARMYALLGMLAVGSTLALRTAVDEGGRLRWGVYALTAVLIAYTHYLGLLVLIGHGLWIVGYERKHTGAWLVSMAVVAAAFAPWLPALVHQTLHAPTSGWYRSGDLPMALADLAGLLAFGGSLVGTAGYLTWYTGGLGPLETIVLLFPFLVLLWFGGQALRARHSSLPLVALPALVPIAVLFGISLVHPMFVPRWFSFVAPFYAMVVAAGVWHIVERFEGRRDQAIVFLVAALFLYNGPALGEYYFAPDARPFQWRQAAAVVGDHVRPGDFFLYVSPADLPFRYYFRDPYPSTVLPSPEAPVATGGTLTAPGARDLARRYPRVWLVATLPFGGPAQDRLFSALNGVYGMVWHGDFGGAHVFLLERRGAAVR